MNAHLWSCRAANSSGSPLPAPVNEPALILADEPTGNLDPDLALEIMNLLRDINASGTTVLVATHDRSSSAAWGAAPSPSIGRYVDRPDAMHWLSYCLDEAVGALAPAWLGAAVDDDHRQAAIVVLGGFLVVT